MGKDRIMRIRMDIPIMLCPHCNRIYFDNDVARLFNSCMCTIEAEDFRYIGILPNTKPLELDW